MRHIAFVLLCAVAVATVVADDALLWSHYGPELKLASVDSKQHSAKFTGQVTISGELVFTFEGNGTEGDLLWAKLIPDPSEIGRLPQVIGGFYPAPLHDIWIRSADRVLVMAFGETKALYYSRGASRYVSRSVTVILKDYASSVECDHRGYLATIVRIQDPLLQAQTFDSRNDLHGC